jgi:Zn-dependent metalloprotease
MADPRATEKAQAAAEKEQAEIEKRERERQWRNENPVLKDPRRDIQEAREARAAEEAARLAEARDVNSEVFKKNQAEAKSKFDDICSRYIHPGRNHAISQDRRNGLKSLDKAVTAGKDKDGKVVYLHTSVDPNHLGILELAKAALRGFEIEDSKVRW